MDTIIFWIGYVFMIAVFAFVIIPLYNGAKWWTVVIGGMLFHIAMRLFIEWNQYLGVW